jgi:hypothetical protein
MSEKITIHYFTTDWECECCGSGYHEDCRITWGDKTVEYTRDDQFGGGDWPSYNMLSSLEDMVVVLKDLGFEVDMKIDD